MKKVIAVVVLSFSLVSNSFAQVKQESTPEMRKKTFDVVWKTVKDEMFDPAFNGVDLEKLRQQYESKIAEVKTDKEFYDLLNQMLGEYRLSHLFVLSPQNAARSEAATGTIGMDVRLIDEQIVVNRVEKDSPAERAGLRAGFVIKQFNDGTLALLNEKLSNARLFSTTARPLVIRENVLTIVNGEPGTTVHIIYLDEQDKEHETTIKREKKKGDVTLIAKGFPVYASCESKRLADGIGYIKFDMFIPDNTEKIRSAVKSMKDAPGIIIDLRENKGGYDKVMPGIAELFLEKETNLGYGKKRNGSEQIKTSRANSDAYKGPVVLLTSSLTASQAEQFGAGLQEIGRVITIGEASPGACLGTDVKGLPTGAVLLYPTADCRTPKGVLIEGRGVIPDIPVKLTRAALLNGTDPQIEEAIKYIQKQKH